MAASSSGIAGKSTVFEEKPLQKNPFKGTSARPRPQLDGGPVDAAFYGIEQKANPQRVPSTNVSFWSSHAESAPVPVDFGLGILSFELPENDEFALDDGAVAVARGLAGGRMTEFMDRSLPACAAELLLDEGMALIQQQQQEAGRGGGHGSLALTQEQWQV